MLNRVAVIDDTPEDAYRLAVAAKRIGDFEPALYNSTSEFRRAHGNIAMALKSFRAIICDNNFQASDGLWGHLFLLNSVGPALAKIPEAKRPLVICFSPSSWEVLRENEQALKEFGILSLHKHDQLGLIGLALRMSAEGMVRPTPETMGEIISAASSEASANVYFTNTVAHQIYDDFMEASSFKSAVTMLTDITPCSLREIRSAATKILGPNASEYLNRYFPSEGSRASKEG